MAASKSKFSVPKKKAAPKKAAPAPKPIAIVQSPYVERIRRRVARLEKEIEVAISRKDSVKPRLEAQLETTKARLAAAAKGE